MTDVFSFGNTVRRGDAVNILTILSRCKEIRLNIVEAFSKSDITQMHQIRLKMLPEVSYEVFDLSQRSGRNRVDCNWKNQNCAS